MGHSTIQNYSITCSAGYEYSSVYETCVACNEGDYSPGFDELCKTCPSSSIPSSDRSSCASCSGSGCSVNCLTPNVLNDDYRCVPCEGGTYYDDKECKECGLGFYSLSGASSYSGCYLCPYGTFNPLSQSSSCMPCPSFMTTVDAGAEGGNSCVCSDGYKGLYVPVSIITNSSTLLAASSDPSTDSQFETEYDHYGSYAKCSMCAASEYCTAGKTGYVRDGGWSIFAFCTSELIRLNNAQAEAESESDSNSTSANYTAIESFYPANDTDAQEISVTSSTEDYVIHPICAKFSVSLLAVYRLQFNEVKVKSDDPTVPLRTLDVYYAYSNETLNQDITYQQECMAPAACNYTGACAESNKGVLCAQCASDYYIHPLFTSSEVCVACNAASYVLAVFFPLLVCITCYCLLVSLRDSCGEGGVRKTMWIVVMRHIVDYCHLGIILKYLAIDWPIGGVFFALLGATSSPIDMISCFISSGTGDAYWDSQIGSQLIVLVVLPLILCVLGFFISIFIAKTEAIESEACLKAKTDAEHLQLDVDEIQTASLGLIFDEDLPGSDNDELDGLGYLERCERIEEIRDQKELEVALERFHTEYTLEVKKNRGIEKGIRSPESRAHEMRKQLSKVREIRKDVRQRVWNTASPWLGMSFGARLLSCVSASFPCCLYMCVPVVTRLAWSSFPCKTLPSTGLQHMSIDLDVLCDSDDRTSAITIGAVGVAVWVGLFPIIHYIIAFCNRKSQPKHIWPFITAWVSPGYVPEATRDGATLKAGILNFVLAIFMRTHIVTAVALAVYYPAGNEDLAPMSALLVFAGCSVVGLGLFGNFDSTLNGKVNRELEIGIIICQSLTFYVAFIVQLLGSSWVVSIWLQIACIIFHSILWGRFLGGILHSIEFTESYFSDLCLSKWPIAIFMIWVLGFNPLSPETRKSMKSGVSVQGDHRSNLGKDSHGRGMMSALKELEALELLEKEADGTAPLLKKVSKTLLTGLELRSLLMSIMGSKDIQDLDSAIWHSRDPEAIAISFIRITLSDDFLNWTESNVKKKAKRAGLHLAGLGLENQDSSGTSMVPSVTGKQSSNTFLSSLSGVAVLNENVGFPKFFSIRDALFTKIENRISGLIDAAYSIIEHDSENPVAIEKAIRIVLDSELVKNARACRRWGYLIYPLLRQERLQIVGNTMIGTETLSEDITRWILHAAIIYLCVYSLSIQLTYRRKLFLRGRHFFDPLERDENPKMFIQALKRYMGDDTFEEEEDEEEDIDDEDGDEDEDEFDAGQETILEGYGIKADDDPEVVLALKTEEAMMEAKIRSMLNIMDSDEKVESLKLHSIAGAYGRVGLTYDEEVEWEIIQKKKKEEKVKKKKKKENDDEDDIDGSDDDDDEDDESSLDDDEDEGFYDPYVVAGEDGNAAMKFAAVYDNKEFTKYKSERSHDLKIVFSRLFPNPFRDPPVFLDEIQNLNDDDEDEEDFELDEDLFEGAESEKSQKHGNLHNSLGVNFIKDDDGDDHLDEEDNDDEDEDEEDDEISKDADGFSLKFANTKPASKKKSNDDNESVDEFESAASKNSRRERKDINIVSAPASVNNEDENSTFENEDDFASVVSEKKIDQTKLSPQKSFTSQNKKRLITQNQTPDAEDELDLNEPQMTLDHRQLRAQKIRKHRIFKSAEGPSTVLPPIEDLKLPPHCELEGSIPPPPPFTKDDELPKDFFGEAAWREPGVFLLDSCGFPLRDRYLKKLMTNYLTPSKNILDMLSHPNYTTINISSYSRDPSIVELSRVFALKNEGLAIKLEPFNLFDPVSRGGVRACEGPEGGFPFSALEFTTAPPLESILFRPPVPLSIGRSVLKLGDVPLASGSHPYEKAAAEVLTLARPAAKSVEGQKTYPPAYTIEVWVKFPIPPMDNFKDVSKMAVRSKADRYAEDALFQASKAVNPRRCLLWTDRDHGPLCISGDGSKLGIWRETAGKEDFKVGMRLGVFYSDRIANEKQKALENAIRRKQKRMTRGKPSDADRSPDGIFKEVNTTMQFRLKWEENASTDSEPINQLIKDPVDNEMFDPVHTFKSHSENELWVSKYDLNQSVTPGWHMVSVVGRAFKTRFYIDGEKIGAVKFQARGNIVALGNAYSSGEAGKGTKPWGFSPFSSLHLFHIALTQSDIRSRFFSETLRIQTSKPSKLLTDLTNTFDFAGKAFQAFTGILPAPSLHILFVTVCSTLDDDIPFILKKSLMEAHQITQGEIEIAMRQQTPIPEATMAMVRTIHTPIPSVSSSPSVRCVAGMVRPSVKALDPNIGIKVHLSLDRPSSSISSIALIGLGGIAVDASEIVSNDPLMLHKARERAERAQLVTVSSINPESLCLMTTPMQIWPVALPEDQQTDGFFGNLMNGIAGDEELKSESTKLYLTWTMSAWIRTPIGRPLTDKGGHVLIGGLKGYHIGIGPDRSIGCGVLVSETGEAFNHKDPKFMEDHKHGDGVFRTAIVKHVSSGVSVDALPPGWHLLTTVIYLENGVQRFFFDSTCIGEAFGVCAEPVCAIGNARKGGSPWGVFADVRVWNYGMQDGEIGAVHLRDSSKFAEVQKEEDKRESERKAMETGGLYERLQLEK